VHKDSKVEVEGWHWGIVEAVVVVVVVVVCQGQEAAAHPVLGCVFVAEELGLLPVDLKLLSRTPGLACVLQPYRDHKHEYASDRRTLSRGWEFYGSFPALFGTHGIFCKLRMTTGARYRRDRTNRYSVRLDTWLICLWANWK
jgi:hypothetical protein